MMMKRRGALCALLLAVLSACGSEDEVGQVRGHVTTEAGNALAGVQVRVAGTSTLATSDAQGDFTLSNLKRGGVTLVASHPDYVDSSKSLEVKAGATAEVSLTLALALGRVAGTVVMEDKSPLAGALVSIPGTDVSAVTDAQGVFTLPAVPPGARTVVARLDHYKTASRDLVVRRDDIHHAEFVLAREGAPAVAFPMLSVQGGVLTLTGGHFGRERGESTVTVGGVPVAEYLSWTDEKIVARVAASLASGDQSVVVTMEPSWRPAVSGSVRVLRAKTVVAGNAFGAGIRPDGTLVTWGRGWPSIKDPPQQGGVVSVAIGIYFSVLLKGDGSLVQWGTGSEAFQAPDVHDGVTVTCVRYSCFVLRADGTVIRWTANADTEELDWKLEVPSGLKDVVGLAGGTGHVVAVTKDGRAVAWGDNARGATTVPADLSDVAEVAPAGEHNVVLKRDGTVAGWGSNSGGESSPPSDLSEVVSVGGGASHSLALTKSGEVRCWGSGYRVCDLPTEPLTQVAQVVTIMDGIWFMVLKQDGTLASWTGEYSSGSEPPPAGLVLAVPPL